MDFRYVVLFLKWMGDIKNEGLYSYFLSYVRILNGCLLFFLLCVLFKIYFYVVVIEFE